MLLLFLDYLYDMFCDCLTNGGPEKQSNLQLSTLLSHFGPRPPSLMLVGLTLKTLKNVGVLCCCFVLLF